ncbi:MAG: hypothetical protein LBI19_07150 [Oscillospiraceae bacterium]|jgi:ketosteroid isomerase-like protein|nr:hypothetical protein [Oscillospiraceae bacterium]
MKLRTVSTIALALLMMLALFGCASGEALPTNADPGSTPESEPGDDLQDSEPTVVPTEEDPEEDPEGLGNKENGDSEMEPRLVISYVGNEKYDELFSLLNEANINWLQTYNESQGDVAALYAEEAILSSKNDDPVRGNQEISEYYKSFYSDISEIIEINIEGRLFKTTTSLFGFETGRFLTVEGEVYQYVIAWRNRSGAWLREIELVTEKTVGETDYDELDEARTKWMEIVNDDSKGAKDLIEGMYMENAYYYTTSRRLLNGWEEITVEYSYANASGFRLYVEPSITVMVQPDLAYEIGKWRSGSNNGNYTFRWEKGHTGEWRLSFEFDSM